MEKDVFYFLVHPFGELNRVQVVDLSYCNKFRRDDYYIVNSEDFEDQDTAIKYAKALAKKHNLTYEPFVPNYYCSTPEETDSLTLTDDEIQKL